MLPSNRFTSRLRGICKRVVEGIERAAALDDELEALPVTRVLDLDRDRIFEIAGSVGLDVARLQKDMDDPKLKAIIERNMALASALGVRGTPAFVIGKQFVPGAVDADTLKQLIADARKG